MPKALSKSHHGKKDVDTEKIKVLQNKQILALTSNLGKLEGKVSEMTKKYEELQKKDALKAKDDEKQQTHMIVE